ncbi:glycosyltransferase family 39 protein [Hydrogenimonas thermophila]|uniref:ArnT family glycosyltransferase n=1 Tax=Hydrogenimonas thermophila TaxID=223786 RepID=UPI0029372036|nr:glycosyltransferase family 39 protein [Hydrogenimonas thermophila]WOE68761.1 glycosyltransferase family 39 protein [Hydrogenimonas thermophila]WOE71271.1 glycosyltransferase family 39 protein [Hydrogenimonas thermophila]
MKPVTANNVEDYVERYGLLFLGFIIYLSFFFNLGSVPLFDLDEGAFSEATREMLASGNYITTYLGGELRFDKPILIYWLQAVSVKLFGLNEFALRLPSSLAATAWVLIFYKFVKYLYDRKIALLSAIFMASALQISVIAKAAIADALLNLCIASSMFAIFLYIQTEKKLWLYITFAAIGFGVLTKGPVAIMVPFVVTFIYFALKRDLLFWLKSVFNPIGILIFLLIAGPWYWLEYQDQGMKFIEGFFFKHNLSRFENSFEGHSGSFLYYIPVLLVGTMPHTGILLVAFSQLKTWFKDERILFLTIWFGFVFIFFSFSGTKLPHYVIYGYTPLFVLMALGFEKIRSSLWIILPVAILMTALIFLPEIAQAILPTIKDEFAKALIIEGKELFGWRYKMEIAILFAALLIVWKMQYINFVKVVFTSIISILLINGTVLPTYAALAQQPIKDAALFSKKHKLNVVMWGINMPSFMVYSEKVVPRRAPKNGEIVLTKVTKLKEIESYQPIFKKYGIVIVRVNKMKNK